VDKLRKKWGWAGLAATLVAGNLLHFLYEWTGAAPAAAYFSNVNESTWEHMKLLAVPVILFTLVQMIFGDSSREGLLWPRALGLLVGLAAIPMLHYTYSGILGQSVMWVDVTIFQIAAVLTFAVSAAAQKRPYRDPGWQVLGGIVLLGIALCFVLFTRTPPSLPLFIDPTTGRAGIPN
jgi:hypothetical protein